MMSQVRSYLRPAVGHMDDNVLDSAWGGSRQVKVLTMIVLSLLDTCATAGLDRVDENLLDGDILCEALCVVGCRLGAGGRGESGLERIVGAAKRGGSSVLD